MLSLILSFLPDAYMPLILVLILMIGGIGIIIGITSLRAVLGLCGALFLFYMFTPLIDAVISELPLWLTLLLAIFLIFFTLRTVLTFLLGEHGSGTFMGHLFYDLMRLPFFFIRGMFRFLSWFLVAVVRNIQARRLNVLIIGLLFTMGLSSSSSAEAKSHAQAIGSAAAKRITAKISASFKPKVYYHATSESAAMNILKKGFDSKRMSSKARLGKGIYLAKSKRLAMQERPNADAVLAVKGSNYLQSHTVNINKLRKSEIKTISNDHDLRGDLRKKIVGPKIGHKLGRTAGNKGFAVRYRSVTGSGNNIFVPEALHRTHPRIIRPVGIENISK